MRTALLDDGAVSFLEEQARKTAVEFDIEPREGPLPLLEWGEQPEYRALTADGRPRIFVSRHAPDWWRIRYQIAHEAFHWLCTPPRTFHWTHELFAVEMAVRAMQEIGEHEYAQTVMGELFEEAGQLSVADMLTTSLVDRHVDGLYGRAWVTGRELMEAVGWERLKPLARSFDKHGRPHVDAWILSLKQSERARVASVLFAPLGRGAEPPQNEA